MTAVVETNQVLGDDLLEDATLELCSRRHSFRGGQPCGACRTSAEIVFEVFRPRHQELVACEEQLPVLCRQVEDLTQALASVSKTSDGALRLARQQRPGRWQ